MCTRENQINKDHKDFIIHELARLQSMKWYSDEKVGRCIFPYVLVEAINLLMNSEITEEPIDHFETGEMMEVILNNILKNE